MCALKAYIEGTLDAWTDAALVMIRRTLETFEDRSSSGRGVGVRVRASGRFRSSLASSLSLSAVTSKDYSSVNETGTGQIRKNPRQDQDQSSVLRRVFARSLARVSTRSSAWRGKGKGNGGAWRQGSDEDEDEGDGDGDQQTEEDGGGGVGGGEEGSGGGEDEVGLDVLETKTTGAAQADFAGLLRDAQEKDEEEEEDGSGDGSGQRLGQGQEGDVMRALLATSEEVVAAVEAHQKVRDTKIKIYMKSTTSVLYKLKECW